MSGNHNEISQVAITLEYLSEASPEMVADLIYKSMTTDDIRQVMNRLFGRVDWDTRRATGQNTWVDEMLARVEPDPDNVLAKATNGGRLARLENRTEHHAERLDEIRRHAHELDQASIARDKLNAEQIAKLEDSIKTMAKSLDLNRTMLQQDATDISNLRKRVERIGKIFDRILNAGDGL